MVQTGAERSSDFFAGHHVNGSRFLKKHRKGEEQYVAYKISYTLSTHIYAIFVTRTFTDILKYFLNVIGNKKSISKLRIRLIEIKEFTLVL